MTKTETRTNKQELDTNTTPRRPTDRPTDRQTDRQTDRPDFNEEMWKHKEDLAGDLQTHRQRTEKDKQ